MKSEGQFLTLKQVAKRLGVSERSMYRYIQNKRIKATKVGYWKIDKKDLEHFIRENSN